MIYIKDKLITQQIMFKLVRSKKSLLKPLFMLCYNLVMLGSKVQKHTPLVDHSSMSNYKITYILQLIMMHLYEHEIPLARLVIFLYPKEILCFNDRCHNNNNVFNKTSIKLCHPIEYLNLLWIFRWWHLYYCLYILWIQQFPFFGNNKTQDNP